MHLTEWQVLKCWGTNYKDATVVSTHPTRAKADEAAFNLIKSEGVLSITLLPEKPIFFVRPVQC